MSAKRALVKNATNPKQVKHAERKTRDRRANEILELRAVLESPVGRRVLWRFLKFCGVNETVLRDNAIDMAAAAGRQNVGHYLMAEIEAADDTALFTMMREERADIARDNRETDALHTRGAQESNDNGSED